MRVTIWHASVVAGAAVLITAFGCGGADTSGGGGSGGTDHVAPECDKDTPAWMLCESEILALALEKHTGIQEVDGTIHYGVGHTVACVCDYDGIVNAELVACDQAKKQATTQAFEEFPESVVDGKIFASVDRGASESNPLESEETWGRCCGVAAVFPLVEGDTTYYDPNGFAVFGSNTFLKLRQDAKKMCGENPDTAAVWAAIEPTLK